MKKKLTLLVASVAILFSACTKNGDNPVISDSNWFFNAIPHFAVKSARTQPSGSAAGKIVFTDTNKERHATLTVYFKAIPQTSGVYTLVKGLGTGLGSNDVAISATADDLGSDFAYTGTAGVTVQVSITTDGKIKIDIPEITLDSASGAGSYKLNASVFEIN